jgi:hypothetical protein
MFDKPSRKESPSGVRTPAKKPKQPATVGRGANSNVAVQDGAGASGSGKLVKISDKPNNSSVEARKERKLAGIRAALGYNGYPPNVIEDLMQNRLNIRQDRKDKTFTWGLRLPNGKLVDSYGTVDANPYPGGKVIEKSQRKCQVPWCTKQFAHLGLCIIEENNGSKTRGLTHNAFGPKPAAAQPLATRPPHVDDGAGPIKGVRMALIYAGYPSELIKEIMEKTFKSSFHPQSKYRKYTWSLKLHNGKRVDKFASILRYPYPGGKVTPVANQVCHTVGCEREFGHSGRCSVPPSERFRFKREAQAEPEPASASPAKKYRTAVNPVPWPSMPTQPSQKQSVVVSPQQAAEAISRKKESLKKVLIQAGYPIPVAEELLEKAYISTKGLDKRGNIKIKFHMRLPNGSSAGNDEAIMLNPYSLGGGGSFGGKYELQTLGQNDRAQNEDDASEEESSILSSNSSEDKSEHEDEDEAEEEKPRAESYMDLLPTEEEDNADEEGEDEYSSLCD